MSQAIITRKGGGGLKINGIERTLEVPSDGSIEKGTFVTTKDSSYNTGTLTSKACNYTTSVGSCLVKVSDGRFLLIHGHNMDTTTYSIVGSLFRMTDKAVTVDVTDTTIASVPVINDTYSVAACRISDNKILLLNTENDAGWYASILTINGNTITRSKKTLISDASYYANGADVKEYSKGKFVAVYSTAQKTTRYRLLTVENESIIVGNTEIIETERPEKIRIKITSENHALVSYNVGTTAGYVKMLYMNNDTVIAGSRYKLGGNVSEHAFYINKLEENKFFYTTVYSDSVNRRASIYQGVFEITNNIDIKILASTNKNDNYTNVGLYIYGDCYLVGVLDWKTVALFGLNYLEKTCVILSTITKDGIQIGSPVNFEEASSRNIPIDCEVSETKDLAFLYWTTVNSVRVVKGLVYSRKAIEAFSTDKYLGISIQKGEAGSTMKISTPKEA